MFDSFRELLQQYNGVDLVQLSDTQKDVLEQFDKGENVMILGNAGTGKSFLIKEMKYRLRDKPKRIVVTGTTGIAAYNIGGITINSFMGVGTGESSIGDLMKRVNGRNGARARIRAVDVLIIDEVSMMSAELFEKLDEICRAVRRNSKLFGGIQLVLTGDFMQLLPVFTNTVDRRLLFQSDRFKDSGIKVCVLKENFRQTDTNFLGLLERVRMGKQTEEDIGLLESRVMKDTGIPTDVIHLVASNSKAQKINERGLDKLVGNCHIFKANYHGSDMLVKDLQAQFANKGIDNIKLKVGARVMLIKNMEVERGLVNGSLGKVITFEGGLPMVEFDNKVKKIIGRVEWDLEIGEDTATATQLPLMLSWAITFHKCQSLTLEKAVLDLGACFCDHQVYVGLSRITTLEGVYLESFDKSKIRVNEDVVSWACGL